MKKHMYIYSVLCIIILNVLPVNAAELTGEEIVEVNVSQEIPDYSGVFPGDEIRGQFNIDNTSEYTYVCELTEESFSLRDDDGVAYVGYRDATDKDVNGVYWNTAREVTGNGHDVQAHIDSGLWQELDTYFNGMEPAPGQSVDVGYVFSFDGLGMTNIYQSKTYPYFASLTWKMQIPPAPEPEPEPTPEPEPQPEPAPTPDAEPTVEPEIELVEETAEPAPEVLCLRTTGYTGDEGYTGLTKSGTQVREGVLAGPEEWLGRSCYLFDMNFNCIGEYTFEDTGCPEYVNAERIDIYFETDADLAEYQKTVGDYAYLIWR